MNSKTDSRLAGSTGLRFHTVLYGVTWLFAFYATDPSLQKLPLVLVFPVGLFAFLFSPGITGGPKSPGAAWMLLFVSWGIYLIHGFLFFRYRRANSTLLLYSILVFLLLWNITGCHRITGQ